MNFFEKQSSEFSTRHIGPDEAETKEMLSTIGVATLDELIDKTIPAGIRLKNELDIPEPVSEFQYLGDLKKIANKNKLFKLPFLLLFVLLCCTPLTLNASVLDSAAVLAPSNVLLAAGVLLTVIGLVRPFKGKVEQQEEE